MSDNKETKQAPAVEEDDREVEAHLIDRMSKLLAEIALILNGEPAPLTRPSYHDLPDKVREQLEVELLRSKEAKAIESGARDERVSMIQTLMLDWINARAGKEAKTVWNRIEEKLAALARASKAPAHADDIAVDSFARAMKDKLAQARAKGRGGWEGCNPADLSRMLREHVEKGDPRDVANFCMMLWHHSASISRASEAAAGEPVAYVPVHPRTGPLWANTVPSLDSDRPAHYPVRALCYADTQHASEPVEEGCTPADAKMLRAANHSLADENARLRRRLRPFAALANPHLSWAMVEYCIDGDPEKQTLQAPQMQRAFNRAADALAEELPSHEPVDCEALDLPDWVKSAKPPAPDQPASEQQAALGWVSVSDRLPESGKTVLATYQNSLGKMRRIRAEYIAPKTREQNIDNDELDGEYDEATDTYYWADGWYECIDNWGDYSHVAVSEGAVTHWMPMPDAPILAAAKGDGHAD